MRCLMQEKISPNTCMVISNIVFFCWDWDDVQHSLVNATSKENHPHTHPALTEIEVRGLSKQCHANNNLIQSKHYAAWDKITGSEIRNIHT